MNAHGCGVTRATLKVLQWTWHKQADTKTLVSTLCTVASPPQTVKSSAKDPTTQPLTEMGFSETEAQVVYDSVGKNRCQNYPPIVTDLIALGLKPSSVIKILEKNPELYVVKAAQLQQRIINLRKLGLLEGSLQKVIKNYPQILSIPVKRIRGVSRLLKEKCQFTVQQVTDIIRDSPHIVVEDHQCLEYMFQYAYFRMGCRQAEMVKAKLFRLSMEELQCRHGFLERRGLYQTPDKKGQTLILNPEIKHFLPVSEETYLSRIAMATQDEFEVFRKLMARELKDEREQVHSSDDDDDDDNNAEKEDEEWDKDPVKQHIQKTGYNIKRKQEREA
ncbi:transcription termination factor 4, mitochondrial-like [Hoplias malabaricus]|uniref:transcription termination factor 4, mitochondrial-like n=1 Tax=Hoplias malabaricus TaxID=27720 RepID=UPI003463194E